MPETEVDRLFPQINWLHKEVITQIRDSPAVAKNAFKPVYFNEQDA